MGKGTNQAIKDKQARALQLRSLGWTNDEIAKELGYADGSGASKAVNAAYVRSIREPAEIVRAMELDRLDLMLKKALEIMTSVHVYVSNGHVVRQRVVDEMGNYNVLGVNEDGSPIYEMEVIVDHAPSLKAIDTALRIMERRAKLLGLDAPTKVEVWTLDYIEANIRRLAEELGEDPAALLAANTSETGDQQ